MPFIICSSMRTGSHALASALDSHSQLIVAGECFYRPTEFGVSGRTPADAVESAFAKYDGAIAHRSGWITCPARCTNEQLWPAIFAYPELRIVNLKRADTLAQTISFLVAQQTDCWQIKGSESSVLKGYASMPFEPQPFELAWGQAQHYLEMWQREYTQFDKLIEESGCPSIEVWYEDLVDDWEGELAKIQTFISVDVETLAPATIKQGGGRGLLKNYAQLQRHFRTSPFAPLFVDVEEPNKLVKVAPKRVEGDNRTINGLWIGPKLSPMELLTIKSFQDNGHEFHLWLYDTLDSTVPDGCIIRDASEIVPRDEVFAYTTEGTIKGSVAGFSDIWRFAFLHQVGGWYVDMDVCCLKPFEFDDPIVLRRQNWNGNASANIIKLPQGHPFAYDVWQQTRKLVTAENIDFTLPLGIVQVQIAEHGLQRYLTTPEHWINVQVDHRCKPDFRPTFASVAERRSAYQQNIAFKLWLAESTAYAIHWCNQHATWVGLDKQKPNKGTLYERCLQRAGLA